MGVTDETATPSPPPGHRFATTRWSVQAM